VTRVDRDGPGREAPPDAEVSERYLRRAREILAAEMRGLEAARAVLDERFARAVSLLVSARGRVVVAGVGKSGLVGRKIAATLTSTGSPAVFVHPVDAMHGDLGILGEDDVAIVVSQSGESEELIRMIPLFRRVRVPVILITASERSTLAREADVALFTGSAPEASVVRFVPTTSSTTALAVGDALAVVVMEARGFREEDFAFLHPGGVIGRKILKRVAELMHAGTALPIVHRSKPMKEALVEIVRARLGMTTVVDDDGRLVGVVTDGDLKRILLRRPDILDTPVGELMTPNPKTIAGDAPVVAALERMENNPTGGITSLVVVDPDGRPEGVIHIHDCLRA
jgi:arabinose-5-phosphate isomerase